MFIRSERLFLRPGWPEDWTEILTQIADEAVLRNLTQVPFPYTADDARAFAAMPQDPRHPHFLITLPTAEGVRTIGCIGFKPGKTGAELGYWIGRDHWGQGYASESVRAALAVARALGHRRIHARHFADNPASGRVLRKAGFCATGTVENCTSAARGGPAPTVTLSLVLGEPGNCDDGNGMMRKRAA